MLVLKARLPNYGMGLMSETLLISSEFLHNSESLVFYRCGATLKPFSIVEDIPSGLLDMRIKLSPPKRSFSLKTRLLMVERCFLLLP